ncbi:MAG: TVP38/TMEM64 family protein [Spirochaetales bacterium]|nr:TVP38/TMEM64 family protein [Spirochaetales bacterium]
MRLRKKIIIIVLVLIVLAGLYIFTPLGELLDLKRLLDYRDTLLSWVGSALIPASLAYILVYTLVTGLSIPGATVMTLLGGFLFGPWLGTFLVNIGATAGAVLIFLAARYFLGNDVQAKYEEKLKQLNMEIEKNGKNYMLTLRLIPVFPFFLINLLSGFTTLPLRTFIWTTSLGIIPGSFVYAYLGSTGASAGASGSFRIQITVALVLLGLLSLLPPLVKKIKERKFNENNS